MSVRINLLPRATRESARGAKQRLIAGGAVLALLLVLAVATLLQRMTLSQAEDDLASAQEELADARAAVAALADYAELERRLEEDREVVVTALSSQVTLAGILQDIALIMPPGIDLGTLTINLVTPQTDEDDPLETVGLLSASGESVEEIAPGIERLLRRIEQVAGFREPFLSSASKDDEDIVSYNLEIELGPEHLTLRYVDPLPEVSP